MNENSPMNNGWQRFRLVLSSTIEKLIVPLILVIVAGVTGQWVGMSLQESAFKRQKEFETTLDRLQRNQDICSEVIANVSMAKLNLNMDVYSKRYIRIVSVKSDLVEAKMNINKIIPIDISRLKNVKGDKDEQREESASTRSRIDECISILDDAISVLETNDGKKIGNFVENGSFNTKLFFELEDHLSKQQFEYIYINER